MKVLLVNKFLYPNGGSETYMFQLAELLRANGHTVAFWGMSDEKNIVPDDYGTFARHLDFGKTGGPLRKIETAFSTVYSHANRKKIAVVLEKFKPEIVHIHNYNFQLTPAVLPEIKRSGARIIHTLHDSQLACPAHRFYNPLKNGVCTKCAGGSFWNCAVDRCLDGSLAKSTVGAFESYFYHSQDYYDRYIDEFISPSHFLAGHIQPRLSRNIRVIPNFTADRRISWEEGGRGGYVLYFGRIDEEKGVLDVQDSFIEAGIPLVIIGRGSQENRIKTSKLIRFVGPKYGDELFEHIAAAKFVIQPSRWYENCPMTVIESFMCGTPVIASRSGGFVEMIRDGENGFLLNFNDPTERSRLKQLYETDANDMRAKCREAYLDNYTPEKHYDQLKRVYNEAQHASV